MCGIAGVVNNLTQVNVQSVVEQMISKIVHRGPDGHGVFTDGNLGLGHRRLAIIDLTEDGHQPMAYADGNLVITFNGEIYNYRELRSELSALGYQFRSHSDTEVILAAYQQWGQDCVSRFNGMWAFALYDKSAQLLFCSRDRFGIKPFYYVDNNNGFYFASEIRQLLPYLSRISAHRDLLGDFLLTSICEHTNETFFHGVLKLPAGHNLVYRLQEQRFSIHQYYELNRIDSFHRMSVDESVEAFRAQFEDAIQLRLRADVPVGTCLSGGLDSSSVASLAGPIYQAASGKAFSAITAVSEQESNNEANFAKEVVDHSGLNWLTVKPSYEDFLSSLDAVVHAQEEPFGSTSLTMQYFVMQAARKNGIPVLLDGQGGDETLLGYPKYYGSYLATTLRDQGFGSFVQAFRSAGANNAKMSLPNAMIFLVGGLVAPARYLVYLNRHRYLAARPAYPKHLSDFARTSWDDFELQKLEITRTNLPVLLRYEDKNSMAHSIETRLPFLDYRVVEMALSLPGNSKIRDGWSKWVLRQAMDKRMPHSITWRKNKFGFEAPEHIWMTKHRAEMKQTVLSSPMLTEMTKSSVLSASFDGLNMRTQWRLYSIALWEKAFEVSA